MASMVSFFFSSRFAFKNVWNTAKTVLTINVKYKEFEWNINDLIYKPMCDLNIELSLEKYAL